MALIMLLVVVQAVHPPGGTVTYWIIDYGLGAMKTARAHKTPSRTLKISANHNQLRIRSAVQDDRIWPCGWCSIWTHQAQDNSMTMWWYGKDDGEGTRSGTRWHRRLTSDEMTTKKNQW